LMMKEHLVMNLLHFNGLNNIFKRASNEALFFCLILWFTGLKYINSASI